MARLGTLVSLRDGFNAKRLQPSIRSRSTRASNRPGRITASRKPPSFASAAARSTRAGGPIRRSRRTIAETAPCGKSATPRGFRCRIMSGTSIDVPPDLIDCACANTNHGAASGATIGRSCCLSSMSRRAVIHAAGTAATPRKIAWNLSFSPINSAYLQTQSCLNFTYRHCFRHLPEAARVGHPIPESLGTHHSTRLKT